jgi:hypothetical protein
VSSSTGIADSTRIGVRTGSGVKEGLTGCAGCTGIARSTGIGVETGRSMNCVRFWPCRPPVARSATQHRAIRRKQCALLRSRRDRFIMRARFLHETTRKQKGHVSSDSNSFPAKEPKRRSLRLAGRKGDVPDVRLATDVQNAHHKFVVGVFVRPQDYRLIGIKLR